jgi:hypothetical protein
MRPYEIVVDYEALGFFRTLGRAAQRELHMRLMVLQESPRHCQDMVERDKSRRDYFIYIGGKFAIKYWIDEAVCEIRILEIQFADVVK